MRFVRRRVRAGVEVAHQHDPRRLAPDLGRGQARDQDGALLAGLLAHVVEMGVAHVQQLAVAAVAEHHAGDGARIGGVPALRRPVRGGRAPEGVGADPFVALALPEQGGGLADRPAVVAAEAVAVVAGQPLGQPADHRGVGLLHAEDVGVEEGDLVDHVRPALGPCRIVGRDVDPDVVAHHPEAGVMGSGGGGGGQKDDGEQERQEAGQDHDVSGTARTASCPAAPRHGHANPVTARPAMRRPVSVAVWGVGCYQAPGLGRGRVARRVPGVLSSSISGL